MLNLVICRKRKKYVFKRKKRYEGRQTKKRKKTPNLTTGRGGRSNVLAQGLIIRVLTVVKNI